jgi:hypothetical protein
MIGSCADKVSFRRSSAKVGYVVVVSKDGGFCWGQKRLGFD